MFNELGTAPVDRALRIVLPHEGVVSDDPRDAGGFTKYGISIRFAGSIGLDLDGDGRTTNADIIALTVADARAIYLEHFWDRLHCSEYAFGLALAVFDCGINQGTGVAPKLLQRAAGVTADGIIGPVTLRAIRRRNDQAELLRDFMARRCKRYAAHPQVDYFGRGWFRRVIDVDRRALHALATD